MVFISEKLENSITNMKNINSLLLLTKAINMFSSKFCYKKGEKNHFTFNENHAIHFDVLRVMTLKIINYGDNLPTKFMSQAHIPKIYLLINQEAVNEITDMCRPQINLDRQNLTQHG